MTISELLMRLHDRAQTDAVCGRSFFFMMYIAAMMVATTRCTYKASSFVCFWMRPTLRLALDLRLAGRHVAASNQGSACANPTHQKFTCARAEWAMRWELMTPGWLGPAHAWCCLPTPSFGAWAW